MVVPAQRLDLDMLAQHIEAHRLGGADIVDKRLVRRRGIEPVRPVALIEQTVLEVRLVIQKQARHSVFILCDGYLAHGKIAEHLVLAAAYAEAVELRVLRAPRFKARHRDLRRERIVLPVKMRVCLLVSPDVGLDRDRCLVNIRGDAQRAHIRLRYGLEPHRLPYTALRSVPYSAALRALLAAGLEASVGIVGHSDGDLGIAVLNSVGDIRLEGQIAAGVPHDLRGVHPHRRALIHRAEVQQQTLTGKLRRYLDFSAIPQVLPAPQRSADSGQLRLR